MTPWMGKTSLETCRVARVSAVRSTLAAPASTRGWHECSRCYGLPTLPASVECTKEKGPLGPLSLVLAMR